MSDYQEKHHHHGDKTNHNKYGCHGETLEHDDDDYYSNYGVDYGERARRILEQSNRRSSAFEPIELNHRTAKLSMNDPEEETNQPSDMFELCNTNRHQRRRHSMFEDTSTPKSSRAKPVIHNIKQLHLDDIVIAYKKKHAQEEVTKHVRYGDDHESEKRSETNRNDNYTPRDRHEDHHAINESKHKIYGDHYTEKPVKLHTSHGSHLISHPKELPFASKRHGDVLFEQKSNGKHVHSNMDRYQKRRSSDVGIVRRSPSEHEVHHVALSRTNGYRSELSSPELERLRAIHGRETRAKESERHALARIITEECRKRHEIEHEHEDHPHGYRRHSGYNLAQDSGIPVPGERRHTLASSTGKEIQRRHKHANKSSRVQIATEHENMRGYETDGTSTAHSKHGDRKHASHDDVTSAQTRINHDFLLAPHLSDRRHSWATIPDHRH